MVSCASLAAEAILLLLVFTSAGGVCAVSATLSLCSCGEKPFLPQLYALLLLFIASVGLASPNNWAALIKHNQKTVII